MLKARHFVTVAATGIMLLLGGSGCKGNNTSASKPSASIINAPAPRTAMASPRSVTIYRARTPSELDAIYQTPALLTPMRPPKDFRPMPMAMVSQNDDAVTGDSSWNVTITREWRHIVVHHSASPSGSAASFDRAHKDRGWDGLGYHFVIGNGTGTGDGQVEVGYRWARQMQGAHAGNSEYNDAGIGICLVGDFQTGGQPSSSQMASLRRLVRFLQAKTGVPTYEVIGHGNVPHKSTECPGRYLDIAAFRQSLGNAAYSGNIPIVKSTASRSTGSSKSSKRSTKVASVSGASMP